MKCFFFFRSFLVMRDVASFALTTIMTKSDHVGFPSLGNSTFSPSKKKTPQEIPQEKRIVP